MKILISAAILLTTSALAFGDNYTVHPGDDVGNVVGAVIGDAPITFAPGTYTLTTNPNGPALTLPAGRQYVGNGAVLALSGGVAPNDNQELIKLNGSFAATEFTGFVCTCAQIHCETGVYNIHGNTFSNGHRGIFVADIRGSHFDHNVFSSLNAEGIYGYPGNSNTYDANTFDNVWQPVHLVAGCDTADISGNVITHATRFGIELQHGMTHLTINNNWMSDWLPNVTNNTDNHMAISCATGSTANGAPWAGQGANITISGNTLIQNGPNQARDNWAKSAIEIMGDQGITISKNYCWNWGNFVLNGVTNPGVTSSGNIAVGGQLFSNDNVPWPIAAPNSAGDKLFNLNDPAAPPWPAKPATQQSSVPAVPATSPSAAVAPVAPPIAPPVAANPTVTHTIAVSIDGSPVLQKQVLSDGSVK